MRKRFLQLPHLPLWLVPLILFSPLLFTGKALFWGTPALQFVPWWSWAWETLQSGHLPLWNPLLGMGSPLLANYQSALFYPPNWLYFIFHFFGGVPLMAWAQALVVVLHLIWAGLGMAALLRRLRAQPLAQAVGALAFSLSGYLIARAWFSSINAAVAWLPWVMLFALEAVCKKTLRAWLKLGAIIGVQLLAGHAQVTWYTLLLAGLWTAFWAKTESAPGGALRALFIVLRAEMAYLGAMLFGAALAAVQLLPTAEYLWQSQRATAVDYDFALNYSFWPWRFLTLLAPNLFGNPVSGNYWGYGNYWEDAVYIGILPLLLALGSIWKVLVKPSSQESPPQSAVENRRALALFLLAVTGLSFLLALGKNTPVFPWLYRHVPTFDMFQAPTRISIWAVFALALLAGMGVDAWHRPQGKGLYWTRLGTAGAFAITLGAGLAALSMGDVSPTFIHATALAGLWAFGVGAFALTAPQPKNSPAKGWQWGVLIWLVCDLLLAGWGLNPGIEMNFYARQNLPPEVQTADGRLFIPAADEADIKYAHFLRFDTFEATGSWDQLRMVMFPNLNLLDHVASANNFDPFVPGRYAVWMDALQSADAALTESLLDLMAVRLLEEAPAGHGSELVAFTPRINAARLRWVPCAESVFDADASLSLVFSGALDFERTVVLENEAQPQAELCQPDQGHVHLEDEYPNRLLLSIQADVPGWVVVSDTWYPGWRAYIDGEPTEIVRANYLFRAVEVPAGKHQIEFVYVANWFVMGGVVSVLAWVAGGYFSLGMKVTNNLRYNRSLK